MTNRSAIQWLIDEIDGLVSTGVLTVESGAALRAHYQEKLERGESTTRVVLLSVIGSVLIGAGVILLIAHNWDQLGRPARTGLSLLPLVASIALSLWTLLKRPGSLAWGESAGVFQTAGVGASIALVSQTYHISGELSGFMLTWVLLTLPLPYLLQAAAPAILSIAGITFWAGTALDHGGSCDGYWLLIAAVLPFYLSILRRDRLGKIAAWLSALLGISVAFGLGFSVVPKNGALWIPAFSGLSGVLYLAGSFGFPERRHHPLRALGALGAAIVSLLLSYKWVWVEHNRTHSPGPGWLAYALAFGFPIAGLLLLVPAYLRKSEINWVAAGISIAGLVGFGLAKESAPMAGALFFNGYAFALSLCSTIRGLRDRDFTTLNGGLLILAVLVVSRFVDSSFGFVERGLAFVLLGAALLAANLWMLKQKKEARA